MNKPVCTRDSNCTCAACTAAPAQPGRKPGRPVGSKNTRSYSLRTYRIAYFDGDTIETIERKGRSESTVKRAYLRSLGRTRAVRGSSLTICRAEKP